MTMHAPIAVESLRVFLLREGIGVGHVHEATRRAREAGGGDVFPVSALDTILEDFELAQRFAEEAMSGEYLDITRAALGARR